MYWNWLGAGSLPSGLHQWRRAEGMGLGICERGAQNFSMSNTTKNAKIIEFFFINSDLLMSGAALKEEPEWTG
jgi:hypothetical protein